MDSYLTYGSILAGLALLATFSTKAKNAVVAIQRIWLVKIELDQMLSGAVYKYCMENMSLIPFRSRTLVGCKRRLIHETKDRLMSFDLLSRSSVMFRRGWRIMWVSPGRWFINPSTGKYERSVSCFFPKLMWNADLFIRNVILDNDTLECMKTRFRIEQFHGINKTAPVITLDETKKVDDLPSSSHTLILEAQIGRAIVSPYCLEDIYVANQDNPFDWYVFPNYVMEVVARCKVWLESKDWYASKRIPWNRGLLVYGNPGTGKTLFLRCLAQYLDLPIFVFDLRSMSNDELVAFWERTLSDSPCMILFEDFDNVFHHRQNVVDSGTGITFDCLLNCISGVSQSTGTIVAVTANDIDKIDDALGGNMEQKISSRPGRIDEIVELTKMDEYCRIAMAKKILEQDYSDSIMDETNGMTAAQLTEICTQIVLSKKYDNDIPKIQKLPNGKVPTVFV